MWRYVRLENEYGNESRPLANYEVVPIAAADGADQVVRSVLSGDCDSAWVHQLDVGTLPDVGSAVDLDFGRLRVRSAACDGRLGLFSLADLSFVPLLAHNACCRLIVILIR